MNPADDNAGAQGRLKNLGYYTGPLSGSVDDDTTDAVRRFQQDAGLPVTGQLDTATQSALAQRHGG